MTELGYVVDDIDFLLQPLNTKAPSSNSSNTSSNETSLDQNENEKLRIVAQPQPSYRGRYITEVDKKKGRPNRFIRSENKDKKHIYPTIKVFIFMKYNE
jgi:hypothetical protein